MTENYIAKDGVPMMEPQASEGIIARELDYKIKNYSHGTYQLTQIFPQNGIINNYIITQSGGADTIFQIPIATYNFAQSYLNFTTTPQLNVGAACTTTWCFCDGIAPIRNLQIYTDASNYLCDLYDVGNYTNMIFRYTTKFEDLQTTDQMYVLDPGSTLPDNAGPPAILGGVTGGMNYNLVRTAANVGSANTFTVGCCEGLVQNSPVNTVPYRTVGCQYVLNGINATNGCINNTSSKGDSLLEPMYVFGNPVTPLSAVPNAQGGGKFYMPVINWKIPLKKLHGTILSLDKSLYIGKILYMRIVWQSSNINRI